MSALACLSCETTETPAGPPRCEPRNELILERALKEGYRALFEGEPARAREAFEKVLELEPNHPEARAGLRALSGGRPPRSDTGARATPPRGGALLAGRRLTMPVPINSERYRFEEELERARSMMAEADEPRPVGSWFRKRSDSDEATVEPSDYDKALGLIDLVILHDSRTHTAREAFNNLARRHKSTHFVVDYDGTVYQTLDLGWEADHTDISSVDRRSVSVDLVNPVTTERPPMHEGADEAHRRPLSNFVHIHGREHQHWGYTKAQWTSMLALIEGLVARLPALTPDLPLTEGGEVVMTSLPAHAESFKGVLGHLHVSRRALDPGAGFDWAGVQRALR